MTDGTGWADGPETSEAGPLVCGLASFGRSFQWCWNCSQATVPLQHELLLCTSVGRNQGCRYTRQPQGLQNVQAQLSMCSCTKKRAHCGLPQRGHAIGLPFSLLPASFFFFFCKLGYSSLPNSLFHLRKRINIKTWVHFSNSIFLSPPTGPLSPALPAAFPKAKDGGTSLAHIPKCLVWIF